MLIGRAERLVLVLRLSALARRCRDVRPAAQALFLAAKKSPPKKAALLTASPSLRYGATCGARAWGVPRNSLRAVGASFKQTR